MQKLLRYGWCVLLFLAVALRAAALGGDASFKPELVGVELASREVRPGDPFALTLKFRNAGTKPAPADYWLFVHFETAEDCRNIAIHADHAPAEPAMFTIRSLDGKPIAESSMVRIYRGFGDSRIRLLGKEFRVAKEEIVRMAN